MPKQLKFPGTYENSTTFVQTTFVIFTLIVIQYNINTMVVRYCPFTTTQEIIIPHFWSHLDSREPTYNITVRSLCIAELSLGPVSSTILSESCHVEVLGYETAVYLKGKGDMS